MILELDRRGDYVPACTRNVFLKYYADAEAQQPHFWSGADKDSYSKEIRRTLRALLHRTAREQGHPEMTPSAATPATAASLTSFAQLFGRTIDGITIREIEIPLVQRDYAQGRKGEGVSRIREDFINALCGTLLPSAPAIDLDFIFGDVDEAPGENQGKFYPLDGQQRLTALFLLHCYLAWRAAVRPQDQPWRRFRLRDASQCARFLRIPRSVRTGAGRCSIGMDQE